MRAWCLAGYHRGSSGLPHVSKCCLRTDEAGSLNDATGVQHEHEGHHTYVVTVVKPIIDANNWDVESEPVERSLGKSEICAREDENFEFPFARGQLFDSGNEFAKLAKGVIAKNQQLPLSFAWRRVITAVRVW